MWRVWLVACGLRPPGRPGARERAGFWVRERGWVRLGAGARPSAWWGGVGECGRAFVCVRAGCGARAGGRGMVYACLAGKGTHENALWVVMRILLVSPRVWG